MVEAAVGGVTVLGGGVGCGDGWWVGDVEWWWLVIMVVADAGVG